jgi:hypothetical protein
MGNGKNISNGKNLIPVLKPGEEERTFGEGIPQKMPRIKIVNAFLLLSIMVSQ